MGTATRIGEFGGELILPGDQTYDRSRAVWNGMVDRRPAAILRCASPEDVVSGMRFGREAGLEIAVKCGGHSVLGLSVPNGGVMIDLTPISAVRIDPVRRKAWVGGGSLLRNLDEAAQEHGLATTAGNVSHTGVGGLTLGGGMGWLARQFGLSCDNVEAYTVVTADRRIVHASESENADLFWGLRGGGGNFGIVTEFEFRLHPVGGRALVVDLVFDAAEARDALRGWRDLLPDAPRAATLTASATTAADLPSTPPGLRNRPIVTVGYVWVGDLNEGLRFLSTIRELGRPATERVQEMSYVGLQCMSDDPNGHGRRRYSKGHYLTELSDAAIDAFLARGLPASGADPDWSRIPNGGFQAYGGAIGDVGDDDAAFSHRQTLVEFGCGTNWVDPKEDGDRVSAARAYAAALEPFASGVYVNALGDEGQDGVRRAYPARKLTRLTDLKRLYDPDNTFHLAICRGLATRERLRRWRRVRR
ncbi:MAG: FAD-dependent oxidoreductase [Chloroflexi bacterium]|nr:MAG: FAD-dependent oxidoreductase [Chloroflexota bacterium]